MAGLSFAQNQAEITRSDSVDCNSLTVNFGANIISGTAISYDWNFGDGNSSTLQNPTHTYNTNGSYWARCVIGFMGGATQTYWFQTANVVGPPSIFQVGVSGTICGPGNYNFFASIDSSLWNLIVHEWTVTYPDGSTANSNQNFPNFNLNQAGTYDVKYKVLFDPACPDSQSITVTVDTVDFNASITDASCGGNDGSIAVTPQVGGSFVQGFVFWSTGDSGNVINNLAPGTYVADFNYGPNFRCEATDTFVVGEIGLLDYTISSVDVACEQDSTGEIDITIVASDGPVTYAWSNGATTEDLTNLTGGVYTVTISDNSCTFTETIDIDADSLDVSFITTDATCAGTAGSLEVVVTGGQTPYTYAWSNGVTTSINPNIASGGYSVVVTDATGCADSEVAFVEPADSCFYTLSGRVFYDENGNCIFDGNDFYLSGGWMKLDNGSQLAHLDSMGNYSFSVPSGTYTVEPSSFSFPYFSAVCPAAGSYNPTVTFSDVTNLDFALQADTNVIDLAVWMSNSAIRPGFTHNYYVYAYNYGSTPMSGLVSFTHDPLVTYLSSDPTATNYDPVSRTAIWSISNLLPGRWIRYKVRGQIAASVPLGTAITTVAEIGPITSDIDPTNNFIQTIRSVVGSFDPNDKQVTPVGEGAEGFIEATENVMHYTIRFQNTGNFPAEFVVLRDTIDPNLRVESIKPTGASHAYTMTLDGNNLEVRFDNIQLPDSASDPAGSQGYFSFAVGHDGVLTPGTELTNQAAIYFDFNKPIITNMVVNTIAQPSSIIDPAADGVLLYPNPTRGIFQVNGMDVDIQAVRVYDVTGKLVMASNQQIIDLSDKQAGIYLVQIQTNKGVSVKRVSLRK